MKLGSFAVGVPQYKIETQVTYQTTRTPTVFERMLMRLCKNYQTTPEIAQLTLSQIFEQQLGVAAADALVGPCVEDLFYLEVLNCPVSQDYMSLRLAEIALTQKGHEFLAREKLPGRSQQTTVQHLFLPLSNNIKPWRASNLASTPASAAFISQEMLEPKDSSAWVRPALDKESHPWKTANTVIHTVESRVTGVMWEHHQIIIECDESGVLSVKAPGSADLEQWLHMAPADLVWQHILQPILTSEPAANWPALGEESVHHATAISPLSSVTADDATAPSSVLLHVITNEAEKDDYPGKNLILLLGKTRSIQGTKVFIRNAESEIRQSDVEKGRIFLEMPTPLNISAGLDNLHILKQDHAPQALLSGWGKVFWGGVEHRAALSVTANRTLSTEIWRVLQTALQSGLNASHNASAHALTALWLPVQETIAHWQSITGTLHVEKLLSEASEFAAALEMFASRSRAEWQPYWLNTLKERVISALTGSQELLQPDDVIRYLAKLGQLLPDMAGYFSPVLLARCTPLTDVVSLERLRKAVSSGTPLPDSIFSSTLVQKWVANIFTDAPLALQEPHALALPIKNLKRARQEVLLNVGQTSLTDAAAGNLSLKSVKTSALTSVTQWQNAVTAFRALDAALTTDSFSLIGAFDTQVHAWRKLATQKLAHPEASGKRLIVLDTSALIERPDLPSRLQRNDTPVVAKRVLEELDKLKTSDNPEKAHQARAAIRALEHANKTVRYESEALELLPADFEPTSDNRILSVALYLRLSDVILVTADRNFRNKAKAENIMAMLPSEYKEMPHGENRPHNMGDQ